MLHSRPLRPPHLAHMAREEVLVLSPHFDDACFSIGSLLEQLGSGTLINVFNRSLYLARLPAGVAQPLDEAVVGAIRGEEDARFAAHCGLTRRQLGFAEPGFDGRRPNDLSGLPRDVEAAGAAVHAALLEHVAGPDRRPYLLAPLALGRHVNHHAVHQIVRAHAPQLMTHFRLGFYEDLPYAHDPVERARGLQRFAAEWRGQGFVRHTWSGGWPAKRSLVAMYATQLRRPASALKFRPAALWPLGVHEALWMRPADLQTFGGADA